MTLLQEIGITLPIIQAPMAGVSTPELAAAVSNAGALGSIGVGATDVPGARTMIEGVRARSERPFNVNLFVHAPASSDGAREADWLEALAPMFRGFGAEPPVTLRPIYKSLIEDDDMLSMLIELAPPVVSFHFGVPGTAGSRCRLDHGSIFGNVDACRPNVMLPWSDPVDRLPARLTTRLVDRPQAGAKTSIPVPLRSPFVRADLRHVEILYLLPPPESRVCGPDRPWFRPASYRCSHWLIS